MSAEGFSNDSGSGEDEGGNFSGIVSGWAGGGREEVLLRVEHVSWSAVRVFSAMAAL